MQAYLNTEFENIKVIAFDFDETLYYSSDIRDYYINFIKNTILSLSDLTEKQAKALMKEVGFTKENKASPSFSSSCGRFGIEKKAYDEYRSKNFFQFDYENAETVDEKFLKSLKRNYVFYIVSNEIYDNIIFKANKLKIDLSLFKKIYAPKPDELINYLSKKQVYEKIITEEKIKPENLLVIGDRIKVDVEPALEVGANGLIITHPDQIKTFFENNKK